MRTVLSLSLVCCLAPVLVAQDAPPEPKRYSLDLDTHHEVGQVFTERETETMTNAMKLTVNGEVARDQKQHKVEDVLQVTKVLAVNAKGDITHRLVYFKAWSVTEGGTADTSLQGWVVEVTGRGTERKYVVRLSPNPATPAALAWLKKECGPKSAKDAAEDGGFKEAMRPKKKLAIGESWKPVLSGLMRAFPFPVDPATAKAVGTLTNVTTENGYDLAHIKLEIDLPTMTVPGAGVPWTDGGVMEMRVSGKGPLSKKLSPMTLSGTIRLKGSADMEERGQMEIGLDMVMEKVQTVGGEIPPLPPAPPSAETPSGPAHTIPAETRYAAGDVVTDVQTNDQQVQVVVMANGQKVQDMDQKSSLRLTLVVRAEAVDDQGRMTRRRIYVKEYRQEAQGQTDTSLQGWILQVTGRGAERKWTKVHGAGELGPLAAPLVASQFGPQSSAGVFATAIRPTKPLAVGERWTPDIPKLADAIQGLKLDRAKITAEGVLAKIDQSTGRAVAVMELTAALPTTAMPGPMPMPWVSGGVMQMTVTRRMPLDAAPGGEQTVTKTTMEGKAGGPATGADIDMRFTQTQTHRQTHGGEIPPVPKPGGEPKDGDEKDGEKKDD